MIIMDALHFPEAKRGRIVEVEKTLLSSGAKCREEGKGTHRIAIAIAIAIAIYTYEINFLLFSMWALIGLDWIGLLCFLTIS